MSGVVNDDIRHTCGRIDLSSCALTWTCHDYLTIVSFGEHWVSLKLANDWYDRKGECNISSALEDLLYDIGNPEVASVFKPTQTPACWNIDLRKATDCVSCTLLKYASQARRRRHKKTSSRKAERKKAIEAMPICRAVQ